MDSEDNITWEEIDYPKKPKLEQFETKDSIIKSLLSLFIFMITFYIVFQRWDYVIMISLVLIVHEMGHFTFMKKYGYRQMSMRFIPFMGAYVSGTKSPISQREQANILLAGPVPGILIGIALYYIAIETEHSAFLVLSKIFIFINAFNLLPIAPMDGGKLVQNLFFSSHEKLQSIFSLISIIALTALCIQFESYIFLIIPGLMYLGHRAAQKSIRLRQQMQLEGLNYKTTYKDLKDAEYWKMRDFIIYHCPEFSDLETGSYRISSIEGHMISKIRTLLVQAPINDINFLLKTSYLLIWISLAIGPFLLLKLF